MLYLYVPSKFCVLFTTLTYTFRSRNQNKNRIQRFAWKFLFYSSLEWNYWTSVTSSLHKMACCHRHSKLFTILAKSFSPLRSHHWKSWHNTGLLPEKKTNTLLLKNPRLQSALLQPTSYSACWGHVVMTPALCCALVCRFADECKFTGTKVRGSDLKQGSKIPEMKKDIRSALKITIIIITENSLLHNLVEWGI